MSLKFRKLEKSSFRSWPPLGVLDSWDWCHMGETSLFIVLGRTRGAGLGRWWRVAETAAAEGGEEEEEEEGEEEEEKDEVEREREKEEEEDEEEDEEEEEEEEEQRSSRSIATCRMTRVINFIYPAIMAVSAVIVGLLQDVSSISRRSSSVRFSSQACTAYASFPRLFSMPSQRFPAQSVCRCFYCPRGFRPQYLPFVRQLASWPANLHPDVPANQPTNNWLLRVAKFQPLPSYGCAQFCFSLSILY